MGDNNTLISMINAMPEYSYVLSSETSNWDFALVYKTANSDCTACGTVTYNSHNELWADTPNSNDNDDDYENNALYQFASRPPMENYLTWTNGTKSVDLYVTNIHYKCCGDGDLDITDKWILSSLNKTILKVNNSYSDYKMNDAVKDVYNFVYNDFCDWYLEFSKSRLYGKDDNDSKINLVVAIHVLKTILKLLHPYTPFITEEIWSNIKDPNEQSLMVTAWPNVHTELINDQVESNTQIIMDMVKKIRNIKVTLSISPVKPITLILKGNKEVINIIESNSNLLERLVKVEKINSGENIDKPAQSAVGVIQNLEFFIPLKGLIDINKEIERLQKQVEDMQGRLGAVNKKLTNENFVKRAPNDVVEHEKAKQTDYQNNLTKLLKNLDSLK